MFFPPVMRSDDHRLLAVVIGLVKEQNAAKEKAPKD